MTQARPNRRQLQAAATRADILTAARHLFTRNGYAATTIAEIAAEAGVAVQTVYKIFTSKDGILLGLLGQFEEQARQLSDVSDFAAGADPVDQLRRVVSFHRQLFAAAQDMLSVFQSAGAAQGQFGLLWEEGGKRRRRAQAEVVRRWHTGGHLRPGLSERRAADQLWAMTSPELYSLLVVQCGWKPDAFEEWLVQRLREMLFGQVSTSG